MDEPWCNHLINRFPDFESIEEKCRTGATVSDFYDRWKLSAYLTFLKIVADGNEGENFDAVVFVETIRYARMIQKALEYLITNFTEYLLIQNPPDGSCLRFRHRDTDKMIHVALELDGLTRRIAYPDLQEMDFVLSLDPTKNNLMGIAICGSSFRWEPADIGSFTYVLEIGKDPNVRRPDPFDTKTVVKLSKFSEIIAENGAENKRKALESERDIRVSPKKNKNDARGIPYFIDDHVLSVVFRHVDQLKDRMGVLLTCKRWNKIGKREMDPSVKDNEYFLWAIVHDRDDLIRNLLRDPRVDPNGFSDESRDHWLDRIQLAELERQGFWNRFVLCPNVRFVGIIRNDRLFGNVSWLDEKYGGNNPAFGLLRDYLDEQRIKAKKEEIERKETVDRKHRGGRALGLACLIGAARVARELLPDPRTDPTAWDDEPFFLVNRMRMCGPSDIYDAFPTWSDYDSIYESLFADERVNPSARENTALRYTVVTDDVVGTKEILTDPRTDPTLGWHAIVQYWHAAKRGSAEALLELLKDHRMNTLERRNVLFVESCAWGEDELAEKILNDPETALLPEDKIEGFRNAIIRDRCLSVVKVLSGDADIRRFIERAEFAHCAECIKRWKASKASYAALDVHDRFDFGSTCIATNALKFLFRNIRNKITIKYSNSIANRENT